ncbi:suppressor of fused domain protein [Cellulomonas bogoriensis]|uniref:Suppressor of fused-like domain-containing protein n=1 Tax=Cellulomonas bogoriensis 69B4 = DSM 16987 TaxID=1386082 RepID=A0A0A0BRN5_9CELL|nr:suppressor of fused domain protein [Cellulomonas bogoriensis]KGM11133.1 hypothetical protein N869_03645 [Cellulomonas bogoriensis 69B4 = DSM 16987]
MALLDRAPVHHRDAALTSDWESIDAVMTLLYGRAVPRHVGYTTPPEFGRQQVGCSAYDAGDHWHYVTHGLTALFRPVIEHDPAADGWGFELTMRVPRDIRYDVPLWPFTMIDEIAQHARFTRQVLLEGDLVDLHEAVTGYPRLGDAPPTSLTVLAVTPDVRLGSIGTPCGPVAFRQLVGVTAAEKAEMRYTSAQAVLARMSQWDRWLMTDPWRA